MKERTRLNSEEGMSHQAIAVRTERAQRGFGDNNTPGFSNKVSGQRTAHAPRPGERGEASGLMSSVRVNAGLWNKQWARQDAANKPAHCAPSREWSNTSLNADAAARKA